MVNKKRKLSVIRGGLPDLWKLEEAELLSEWKQVTCRMQSLDEEARVKQEALNQAASAYDEVVTQLNELSHLIRHYRRELARRGLES